MTSTYATSSSTIMKKTAKPMTGGMIWPPLEAAASIAAASSPRIPTRFIIGMVMLPEMYTLPIVLPETVPTSALDVTAISGGPVRPVPKSARASPITKSMAPTCCSTFPRMRNSAMYFRHALRAKPMIPASFR